MLSLYIPIIHDNDTELNIKTVFKTQMFGQVDHVDFVRNKVKNRREAFVHFKVWYDNDAVSEFIKCLNNPETKTRIYHTDNKFWPVLVNRNNNPENKNPNYINEVPLKDITMLDTDAFSSQKDVLEKLKTTIEEYNKLKTQYMEVIVGTATKKVKN
jgi:hypothetical protein|tara:strand:- start:15316 stop:15783 length:468 start_codon:yes stop_codon:yes gene_type:complete